MDHEREQTTRILSYTPPPPAAPDDDMGTSDAWFSRRGQTHRRVSYEAIMDENERTYMTWRTPSRDITHEFSFDAALRVWLEQISVDDLAALLRTTPRGLSADERGEQIVFTPHQRLSMAFYVNPPFALTSRVRLDSYRLRVMADYADSDRQGRAMPFDWTMSMMAGSIRDVGIIDLPVGSGKTSWVTSVGMMMLCTSTFSRLVDEHLNKLQGAIISGPFRPRVARLLVIACAGGTNGAFVNTVHRAVSMFRDVDPSLNVIIWTTIGARTSVQRAFDMPHGTAVVWVVPMNKLNSILRAHPDIVVPVCVMDEYTQDTPREKWVTPKSPIMKHIIAQATPSALENATSGNRSFLRDVFGDRLCGPNTIHQLIRRRSFKDATTAMRQLCMLDLMTVTPFRERVRSDLAPLMPNGMHVSFIRSRRVSMTSHLAQSSVDMIPASLSSTLLRMLSEIPLDGAARQHICTLDTLECVTPHHLTTIVTTATANILASASTSNIRSRFTTLVQRVTTRIEEFAELCPICMSSNAPGVNIMGCCGYCLCDGCHASLSTRVNCAFCRAPVHREVSSTRVIDEDEDADDTARNEYPPPMQTPFDPRAMRNNTQSQNLTYVMHHAMQQRLFRLLIIVRLMDYSRGPLDDLDRLSTATGYRVVRVDNLLSGKGTRFEALMREFDNPTSPPMAFVCYGHTDNFMYGIDLGHADGIVGVGEIPQWLATQTLGRIFRPRQSRDSSVPVHYWSVYC